MGAVLFALLVMAVCLACLVGFRDELDGMTVIDLLLTLVCLTAILVIVWHDRYCLRATRVSRLPVTPGLVFRQSRSWQAACVLGLVSLAVLGTLISVQVSREDAPGSGAVALYVGSSLTWFAAAWLMVPVLLGRARNGGVRITVDGVALHSWGTTLCLRWDDVLPSSDERPNTVTTVGGGGPAVKVVAAPGRTAQFDAGPSRYRTYASRSLPDLAVPVIDLAGNASVLAHAVAFYAEHPELRDELADDRARERVTAGRALAEHLVTPPEKEKK